MKSLDLGNSDFRNIIENNNYFVDKSLLIEEIIDAQNQVILLPRPRRFGKTLNLSMLKYFFDKSEPENKNLFTELKIWKSREDIKQHCGKYPIIYLSFKDAKANIWEDCFELLVSRIVKLYSMHDYLLESSVLKPHEKIMFNEILSESASKVKFQNSLEYLSDYLYRYHNQKVVILIDEYDTPIQSGYKKYYDEVVLFMRNLLSGAFKDNSFLYKGVITGILRVSKESIFSGLNNLSVFSILDNQFSDKFGFTELEVKQIVEDFKVEHKSELIRKWYNGYKFGRTEGIYNAWSILNDVLHP